jgi:putative Holliday junction resolvase
MGLWAGIDYGKRRIGAAISDPRGRIASPATTLDSTGGQTADAGIVLCWAAENEVAGIVVGLPLNMDGTAGPQAELSRGFADQLRQQTDMPIELWDERLTSYQADELMQAAGLSRARQKKQRDALAAQIILQSFLDAHRPDDEPPRPILTR